MKKLLFICLLCTFVFAAQRENVDIVFTPKVSTERDVITTPNPLVEQLRQAKINGDLATYEQLLQEYKKHAIGELEYDSRAFTGTVDPEDSPSMRFGDDVIIYSGDVYWDDWAVLVGDIDDEAISVDYHRGDTIIAAVACADSLVRAFKSYDNGLTWTYVRWFSHSGRQLSEPEVIWGGDDWYHVFMRSSDDNGDLMCFNVRGNESDWNLYWIDSGSDTVRNYSVCSDKADYMSVMWLYCAYHVGDGGSGFDDIYFTRSTDDGATWEVPTGLQSSGSGFPDLTYGDGMLYEAFYGRSGSIHATVVNRSTNLGNSWEGSIEVQNDANLKHTPQIAAGHSGDGDVWVVWPRRWSADPFDYDLFWSWSNDEGQNWSSPNFASSWVDIHEFLPSLTIFGSNGTSAHYPWLSYTTVAYDYTDDPWVHMRPWNSSVDDFGDEETYADNATTLTRPIQTFDSDGETPAFAYVGYNGENVYFDSWFVGIEEEEGLVANGGLASTVKPNPFTRSTHIEYTLPTSARVSAKVYNILGQAVTTLFDGIKDSGTHELQWNAGDLPKGIYFLKIETTDAQVTKKVIIQ